MPDPSDSKKEAVKAYLEQVKVITALATTLLLTPNVMLTLEKQDTARAALNQNLAGWETWLVLTNLAFLLTIGLTYLIYATLVGSMYKGDFDVYRGATRVSSIAQLVTLVAGCVGLFVILKGML